MASANDLDKSGSKTTSSAKTVATTAVTIEDLYKYFGILADAKENAGQVIDQLWYWI